MSICEITKTGTGSSEFQGVPITSYAPSVCISLHLLHLLLHLHYFLQQLWPQSTPALALYANLVLPLLRRLF